MFIFEMFSFQLLERWYFTVIVRDTCIQVE